MLRRILKPSVDSEEEAPGGAGSSPGAVSRQAACHLQAPSLRRRALAPPSQAEPGLVGPVTPTCLMNKWRPLSCLFHLKGGACVCLH